MAAILATASSSSSAPRRKASRRVRNDGRKIAPGYGVSVVPSLDVFARRSPSLSLEQAQAVTEQLGYLPMNLIAVGAAGRDGQPQVAVLYPLLANELGGRYDSKGIYQHQQRHEAGEDDIRGKPFPTMLWMTHPALHAAVCKLEDAGWIGRLESRLHASPELLQRMRAAHEAYALARCALLSEADQTYVASATWAEAVRSVGIAGIREFCGVKCLHCHLAHHLGRPQDGNVVGEWVRELLAMQGEVWHYDLA